MTTSHTPGPWNQGLIEDQQVSGPDGVRVADCGTSWTLDADEMTANARLIAAAPELLEALLNQEAAEQWIADNHQDEGSPFFEATYSNMLGAARTARKAAIAKATGSPQTTN